MYIGEQTVGKYGAARSRHSPSSCGMAITIGYEYLMARRKVYQQVVADGYCVPALIQDRAYVRDLEAIGRSTVVMPVRCSTFQPNSAN